MKQLFAAAFMALGLSAHAQTSETRKVMPFTKIDAKDGIEVIFTQDNSPSLKVESDSEAFLENIVTEFSGKTLKIYLDENIGKSQTGTAKVYVSQKDIDAFKGAKGSTIIITEKLTVDKLDVTLTTGASFTGVVEASVKCHVDAASGGVFRSNVTTALFEGQVSSGANIKVVGHAEATDIHCDGGYLHAAKLMSATAMITASNAGSAYINVRDYINADADSSSSITFYGEPTKVDLGMNTYAIKRNNYKFALN